MNNNAATFLGLAATHNPYRFHLPIRADIANMGGTLFGGTGLGAAIEALETVTGRPVVWATAQYLSYARVGEVLDLDITISVSGHNITQALVIGHVADREVLAVNAALGLRDAPGEGEYAQRPEAPPPAECPLRQRQAPRDASIGTSISEQIEMRFVRGRSFDEFPAPPVEDGRTVVWARLPSVDRISAMSLAILGDWVPFGMGQALGVRAGGNSLDNTLRVVQLVPTEWVLLDIRIHAIRNGFGHGLVHQWAEDGTLLATASQSVILRYWKD